ncbi:MAG: TonB-dependent receptor plug domain-containing protein [Flavobacteriaceae bacterium]|nr:TonB-dependent receptor plug domain-containing protein [Flavobacteriaceae bacterium]
MRFNLLLFLLAFQLSQSQDFRVTGTVLSQGQPLTSASVYIENSKTGTSTDIEGQFTLSFSNIKNPKLVISFLGYKTQIKKINSESTDLGTIELELEEALEEIVVSGTLKAVSKRDSPVPVEVYGQSFFKANPTASIFDALENINGVRSQLNCSICSTGSVNINGQEGSYTMVLIDGFPIVSGLSTVYGFSGIPQALIERIEVIKGPASTLYGSEAVAGVINLITKLPENTSKLSVDSFFSGWGEVNTDLAYKYQLSDKTSAILGVNYFNYSNPIDNNKDGFTDLTLQDRISIFNKFTIGNKFSIATRFVYEDRWGGQMGWLPKHRGGEELYGESIFTRRFEFFGKYQFNKNLSFQYSFNDHNQNSAYGKILLKADQTIGFGQMVWNKNIAKHELLMGLAYRFTFYDDNTTATFNDFSSQNMASITHLPGLFIQNQTQINPYNTLLLGIRYDHNSIHGDILTPRINYKINNSDKSSILRLSAGTGYRVAQVFTEDHAALTGARKVVFLDDLNPERSWNANMNFVQKFYLRKGAIIDFDFSLFTTHFSNKIIPDYETDPNKIIYDNLTGKSTSNGISLNINLFAQGGLRINVGATYIDTYVEENGIKTVPFLTERFQGVWKVEKKWIANDLTLDFTGTNTGALRLPTLGNLDPRPSYSDPFSILNVQLTKTWNNTIEYYGGVKNILNFVPPSNSITRPFDPFDRQVVFDQSGNALPTPSNPYALTFDPTYVYTSNQGIRFFFGIRWKYN